MEKTCDLCLELRPVVYCKADTARLCLSCDAKVHSANPIVDRHHRTLLCESCKYRSAEVQCLDHRMFMCRVCDLSLHRNSFHRQHQKRTMISSYTGCPSAKDFAGFWGFKLNDTSRSIVVNLGTSGAESDEVGSSSQRYKIAQGRGGRYQKSSTTSNSFILDQILDLKRLPLSEGNSPSLPICGQDQHSEKSSSVHDHNTPRWSEENHDYDHDHNRLQHSLNDLDRTISKKKDRPLDPDVIKVDPLPFPFSHQSSSSTIGFPLHGRSMVQNSQLWSQNMQDLGVCEELAYNHADPKTPDVDLTFRNFEESFGGYQDVLYPFTQKDVPHQKPHKGHARAKQR